MDLMILVILILTILLGEGSVFISSAKRLPLKEEEHSRRKHNLPGCWLGDDFYKFGERWSPVIEPFGLRVCVKCQCGQVEKNGVLERTGRVVCKNIQDECPVPRCDNPVLRDNTCCRVCPASKAGYQGSDFEDEFVLIPDVLIDNSSVNERTDDNGDNRDDEDNGNVHGEINNGQTYNELEPPTLTALLVGNNTGVHGSVKTRGVAMVRLFVLSQNRLSYAIRYAKLKKLRSIQLHDSKGNVLMERDLSRYTKQSGKICGVFENAHPAVMTSVANNNLSVTMTTNREGGNIAGNLRNDASALDGTFNAVLSTSDTKGAGGNAILKYDVTNHSATYEIRFAGMNTKSGRQEYLVTFAMGTKVFYQRVLTFSTKADFLSGTLQTDNSLSKRLARGRLELRVTSVAGVILRGIFRPRLTCGSFHAGLVATGNESPTGSGYAVIELLEDGGLSYKVQLSAMADEVLLQRHVNGQRWKTFRNITQTFQTSDAGRGVIKKIHAKDIAALLDNQLSLLAVSKITGNGLVSTSHPPKHRGRFVQIPYMEHIDVTHDTPVLLRGQDCPVVAFAWLTLGRDCRLRHHIMLPGQQAGHGYSFTIATPGNQHGINKPVQVTIPQSRRTVSNLPGVILASLHAGFAVVLVDVSYIRGCGTVRGNVTIQNTCWLREVGEDSGSDVGRNEVGDRYKLTCFYQGKFYEDGESWRPVEKDSCHTCTCQSGRLRCHHVICPPLNCSRVLRQEGQCCPICEEENSTEKKPSGSCYYHGDKRWHPVGVTWHPYVPPFGYAKCAVCTCLPRLGIYEVNCTRVVCPTLNCHSYQRYRQRDGDCCQVCRETVTTRPLAPDTDEVEKRRGQTCEFGGRTYRNREKWHPYVPPFGPMKCYECRCRGGKSTCRKKRCKSLDCKRQYRPSGVCCPVCMGKDYDWHRRRRNRKRQQ